MAHSTCDLEMGMGRLVTLSHEACSEPLQIFSAKSELLTFAPVPLAFFYSESRRTSEMTPDEV
jgi:hypothetical protein